MTDPSGLLTDSAFRTVRIGSGVLSACVQEVFHVAMGFVVAGSIAGCLFGVCISKTGGLLNGFFGALILIALFLLCAAFIGGAERL